MLSSSYNSSSSSSSSTSQSSFNAFKRVVESRQLLPTASHKGETLQFWENQNWRCFYDDNDDDYDDGDDDAELLMKFYRCEHGQVQQNWLTQFENTVEKVGIWVHSELCNIVGGFLKIAFLAAQAALCIYTSPWSWGECHFRHKKWLLRL